MNTRAQETADYAAAVRAALADVPDAEREELLDDLEEHLVADRLIRERACEDRFS
jgi:hypothetical protein